MATGHAEYANHGRRHCVSSISTNLQLPLAGITEILGLSPNLKYLKDFWKLTWED